MSSKPINERLWSKADIGGPDDCWPWTAHRNHRGYGRIIVSGKVRNATRLIWELTHGAIPVGMFVCHSCDNPPCVNPAHLWLGTHRDNMRDMSAKGRAQGAKITHCPHGHEYTQENTGLNGGSRICRACHRNRYHRRKAEAAKGQAA